MEGFGRRRGQVVVTEATARLAIKGKVAIRGHVSTPLGAHQKLELSHISAELG